MHHVSVSALVFTVRVSPQYRVLLLLRMLSSVTEKLSHWLAGMVPTSLHREGSSRYSSLPGRRVSTFTSVPTCTETVKTPFSL